MPAHAVHELIDELDYPMFIVTVAAGGERAGCLVGFATQCSINPPRFLVCLSDKNRTFRVEIGRASCRKRVEISVVAVSLKKKKETKKEGSRNNRLEV